MKYLLDTNTCIRYINGRAPGIRVRLSEVEDTDIAVSAVTKGEMFAGSARSQHPVRSRAIQEAFLIRFTSLPFDDVAADIFGQIRATLESMGQPIGPYDMQIAAIAIANGLTVVTHNTREFGRVAHLKVVDWEV